MIASDVSEDLWTHRRPLLLTTPIEWTLLILGCVGVGVLSAGLVRSSYPLLIVGLLLAPLLLYLATRMPGVVFAAYLYIPFYKGAIDPYLPVDITAMLAVLCLTLAVPTVKTIFHYPTASVRRTFILWTIILILIVGGTLYASSQPMAIGRAIEFTFLVYLPSLLALRVGTDTRLQLQFIYATIGISAIVIILAFLSVGALGANDRVAVLGTNTIGTGRAAMLLPLVAPAMLTKFPLGIRPAIALLIPMGVVATVFAGSRGPLLMGAASIVIVYLLISKHRIRNVFLSIFLVAGIVGLIRLPAIQNALPAVSVWRIESLFEALITSETEELDTSSAARLELWQFAAEMFFQNPLLGLGTAGFEAVVQSIPGWEVYVSPHNLLLQFASEFGVVGATLLIVFISTSYINGLRYIRSPLAVAFITLATFGVTNSLVGVGIYDARWFWGYLLILMSLSVNIGRQSVEYAEAGTHPGHRPNPTIVKISSNDR